MACVWRRPCGCTRLSIPAFWARPLEHVVDIALRGDGVALEGAEQWRGARGQPELGFRAQPAVNKAEGHGIEADRAGLAAFTVMNPKRARVRR